MQIQRDTDANRTVQGRRDTILTEILEQYIAAQRETGRDHRAVMTARPQGFQKEPYVTGLTGVVATGKPVPVVAAVSKMYDGSPPAVIRGGLERHSGVGRFRRPFETMQNNEYGRARFRSRAIQHPVDDGDIAVRKLEIFALEPNPGCARNRQGRVNRLGMAILQPPGW